MQQRGINQGNHLALVDPRIEVNVELRDDSGYLGTNLHGNNRVDHSRGFHHVADFTALYFGRKVLRLAVAAQPNNGNRCYRNYNPGKNQPFGFCFHHKS